MSFGDFLAALESTLNRAAVPIYQCRLCPDSPIGGTVMQVMAHVVEAHGDDREIEVCARAVAKQMTARFN